MPINTPETQTSSNAGQKLPIDSRPEWTLVSLGRDFNITLCIVADRILITRPIGFLNTQDADRYTELMEKVKVQGLPWGRDYIHVMEWSSFKGGSVAARQHVWNFHKSQPHLKAILFCGATAFMRMGINLIQRVSPQRFKIQFFPEVDQAIHSAGKQLGMPLPEYFQLPSIITDQKESSIALSDQIALLCDPPLSVGHDSYKYDLPNGQILEFKRIGSRKLFCRLKGANRIKPIPLTEILKARNQAVLKCLPGQSAHIEIWDCTNFHTLFSRRAIIQLLKALFSDPLPLTGCFLLDICCRIRSLARWCMWQKRPAYPVHCPVSLTVAILQSQELLLATGRLSPSPVPMVDSKPHWHDGDDTFFVENEIIDQDIIHSRGSGYMKPRHIRIAVSIQRQLALEIVNSGRSYYIMGGTEAITGGSYKARKRFIGSTRKLYRDFPFHMYVFYGAKGKTRTAINLAKHSVPYRMKLVDDYESALAMVRADKVRRTYLVRSEGSRDPMPLPPAASQVLQQSVDGILRHLSNLDWEPDSPPLSKPLVHPNHPFGQIYDAIDLINEDLKTIYRERQEAVLEQQKLQEQLARSRKMEAIGLMAGGVAHDLNNILSGIVSYPDAILMDLGQDHPLRQALVSIRESGKKSAEIVKDLLIMARRNVNAAEPVNLNELIQDYLDSPEYITIAKRYPDIRINTHLSPDLKQINASPLHIKQTIMNLVINALEASDSAGTVAIYTENRSLNSPARGYETIKAGHYATLMVEDQGVGISQKDQEHIFEPFYTKKKMGRSGTGLGMAVVWGTVQDCNGSIDLRSTLGSGTLFTLYFPVNEAMRPKNPAPKYQDIIPGKGESILVVDDVQQQRQIAMAALSRMNYRVSAVEGGEAALRLLEKRHMDLVIVDMIMDNGIDGLETITRIRQNHSNQKMIICTGYSDDKVVEKAQALCNGPMVNKPYTIQTLTHAVYEALHPAKG